MTEPAASPERAGRRNSLTKTQRESSVGADLLALCQTMTSDGSLADAEVHALKDWLAQHRHEDLPAVAFLIPLVDRIVADGKITPDERRELHVTIEAVLPTDIRTLSRTVRREREKTEARAEKERQRQERDKQRQELALNDPVEDFDFMVAGCRYEGRPAVIAREVRAGDDVVLAREPNNRYSRNAVAVLTKSGQSIGYVPEDDAVDMAPLMDASLRYRASVKKMLDGSASLIPVVVAEFYGRDATVEDLSKPISVQARAAPARASAIRGYIYLGAMLLLAILIIRACV